MRNALQNPPVPLNVARAVPPASLPAENAIPAVLANPLHPLIPMLERLLVGESAPAQGFNGNIRAPIALPEHKLVAVLLARCSIDPNPVLSYQLRKLPLYKLQLTASAWQRVLDELIISGLLGNGLNGFTCTLSQLDARLRQLQILNPEKLVIADADVLDLWPPVLVAPLRRQLGHRLRLMGRLQASRWRLTTPAAILASLGRLMTPLRRRTMLTMRWRRCRWCRQWCLHLVVLCRRYLPARCAF